MDILTSQSWRVLKSWYTGGSPENEFQRCFAEGLNQKLSSLYGAGYQKDVTFGSLILYPGSRSEAMLGVLKQLRIKVLPLPEYPQMAQHSGELE